MANYTVAVTIGIVFGTLARLYMMRTDYRQYPSYPHGRIIHFALGVIAASLGSVAIPALLQSNWTAVTFLSLAAQQFRDVRNMERNMLQQLDTMELVPRGVTYIEGIAQVFEGRNYLVMLTSIVSTFAAIKLSVIWAVAAGILTILIDKWLMSGKVLSDIATIEEGELTFNGPNLYVGGIHIMNIGLQADRETIQKHGVGLVVIPKSPSSLVTIANLGQRQAILHDVSTIVGVYRDTGEPGLVPMAKRDLENGRLGLFLLPQENNSGRIMQTVKRVPVLDSAVRMPREIAGNSKQKG
ncbi:YIEGIA family protein [Aneurinibacillus tyrosinisolvens]|uniref:YIEGIA family protein n=1 Tax=Aneurinibacillus tyrosinisolvens TaxID=1443435 RepID=UPI00063F600E|nr:YIEGIA family protein [Aneurinibacillus tyrosinisolvens]